MITLCSIHLCKMAAHFREFELMCLSDLAGILDYEVVWKPLYRTWLNEEYHDLINYDLIKIWVKNVVQKKHFMDINSVLYGNTDHFPTHIQKNIIYTIKNKIFVQLYYN